MLLKSILFCGVFQSLEPNHTSLCKELGQDFLAVGWWRSFAQARSRWPSRSRSNLFSWTCLLTDQRKHLALGRQELKVVDEVVPLLIGTFQRVRAREQTLIAGSGVDQDTVPDVSWMCWNVIGSTASSGCSSCLFRWQWMIRAESVHQKISFQCLKILK